MLLAEALAMRADIQRRLTSLKGRLLKVARVQEGERPDEDPAKLLSESEELMRQLEELICRINATNSATKFDETRTLTDAIAARDVALMRRRLLAETADAASTRQDVYSRSEVRYVSSVDVPKLRAQADEAAKEYRLLDTKIQQLNWLTELN